MTINYFTGGRFDQVILFWGPIWQRADLSIICQKSFDKVKNLLCLEPVLTAPDFSKPFQLAVDASDVGAGAVLLQSNDEDIEHPVCYF